MQNDRQMHLVAFLMTGPSYGFVPTPTTFPGMFEQFSRSVVPPLQKRGVFDKEYAGRTLRGCPA